MNAFASAISSNLYKFLRSDLQKIDLIRRVLRQIVLITPMHLAMLAADSAQCGAFISSELFQRKRQYCSH